MEKARLPMSIDLTGKRLRWLGRFAEIREIYFQKRSKEREEELENLLNDVENIVAELKRLERKAQVPCLISNELRRLNMQLLYWENRKRLKTDSKTLEYICERFQVAKSLVRVAIFNKDIENYWYIMETEGGNEIDIYVPPPDEYIPGREIKIKGKNYNYMTKKQLRDVIAEMARKLDKLEIKNG